jgi:predicted NBD/HSP70 family sugar kinase
VEREGLRPVGVAVALPGLVDPRSGILITAPNLGWREVRMAELLQCELERPALRVDVDNDGNLGALAELWEGVGTRYRDFVFVSGEAGVGAGLVSGGELLRGSHGFSGEFGHMTIHPDGARCGCGSRGCLETVIGQEALLRRAGIQVDPASRASVLAGELLARAAEGDDAVLQVLQDAGDVLGRALASVVNLLNPEAVVLGGQFALLARWLAPRVEREIGTRVLSHRFSPCQVVASSLGSDAAVRGAAALSLRRVLHEPWTVAVA